MGMGVKFKYRAKDEIPSEHQALFVERDGAWFLDCDGVAEKTKLDEFRSNNVALLKQVEDLKKRYEGIDPDEVRKLREHGAESGLSGRVAVCGRGCPSVDRGEQDGLAGTVVPERERGGRDRTLFGASVMGRRENEGKAT
jgi:hypothetical protein